MSPLSRRKKWSVFIDLGHSKSRLVAISPDFSEMRFYQVPAAGLAKGKILDRDAFTDSLRQLTEVSGINGLSYTASVNVPANQTRTVVQTVNCRLNGSYRARDYESIIEGSFESTFGGLDEVIDVCNNIGLDDWKKALRAIGSLGGGNHFIEIGKDSENNYWVTIHSGSRNFGLKVANYYQSIAKANLKKYFI